MLQDVALEALSKPDLCVFIVPRRARIPSAGSFHCSETGLGFEVSTAVTVEYEYGSWAESLSPSARQEWMVAGPLFHIRAKPNTVRAVHLPHFLCLAGRAETGRHWARCWSQGLMVALNHSLQPVGLGGSSSSSSSWSTAGVRGPGASALCPPLPSWLLLQLGSTGECGF